jgi:tungstate transport system permease protein
MMGYFGEGLAQALKLLFPPSREVLEIVGLSLAVSGAATVLAAAVGAPLGMFLSLVEFRGRRLIIGLLQTAMSIPAVLIGLVVYILVSRRGLLGFFGLLFTPGAMILAQALLAFPIITALSLAALKGQAKDGRDLAYALGASRRQMLWIIIRQGRFAFLTAMVAGFSRVLGETGMTLMVGGNIKGATRVMTTAISLETMKGNFEIGLALGIVLLAAALIINIVLQWGQGR